MTESRFGFLKEDFGESVEWYQKAAVQGNAAAQYNLGLCYEEGKGVAQDDKKVVEWHQKAADQGDPDARNRIDELQKKKSAKGKSFLHSFFHFGNNDQ